MLNDVPIYVAILLLTFIQTNAHDKQDAEVYKTTQQSQQEFGEAKPVRYRY
jgi:hypothetical protein